MQITKTVSLVMLLGLVTLVFTTGPSFIITSSLERNLLLNTTTGLQLPASINRSGSAVT